MASLCIRQLPRLSRQGIPYLSLKSLPFQSRPSSTTSPSKASNPIYYLHTFLNSSDQYILLLPRPSLPMGRISLPHPPNTETYISEGPAIDFISPLESEEITLNQDTFVENQGFRKVLQEVVRENIEGEEMIRNEASGLQGGEGWIHLCDERQ